MICKGGAGLACSAFYVYIPSEVSMNPRIDKGGYSKCLTKDISQSMI